MVIVGLAGIGLIVANTAVLVGEEHPLRLDST